MTLSGLSKRTGQFRTGDRVKRPRGRKEGDVFGVEQRGAKVWVTWDASGAPELIARTDLVRVVPAPLVWRPLAKGEKYTMQPVAVLRQSTATVALGKFHAWAYEAFGAEMADDDSYKKTWPKGMHEQDFVPGWLTNEGQFTDGERVLTSPVREIAAK